MKNNKFLSVVMFSITVSLYSFYAHATTKQDNEQTKEPQKTVRIVVEQSYRDGTSPVAGISLPFESIAQRFLEYARLTVVAPDTKDSDYTLKIQASGQALGAQYSAFSGIGGQYYYTGASLRGAIVLERASVSLHDVSFLGVISPPTKINTGQASTSPSDAPFYEAFRSSGFASEIVKMLGEIYGLQFLLNALKDGDMDVRIDARMVLEKMGAVTIEPLSVALKAEDADVRKTVVQALGEIKKPWAVELLITALKDENVDIRKAVAAALGEPKDPRAVDPLITTLKDEDEVVRGVVAAALGEIKDPRAVEPLIATLKDKEFIVQGKVAQSLGEIQDSRAIEPLIETLKSESTFVQKSAVEALKKITKQPIGDTYEAWFKWWQEHKE